MNSLEQNETLINIYEVHVLITKSTSVIPCSLTDSWLIGLTLVIIYEGLKHNLNLETFLFETNE